MQGRLLQVSTNNYFYHALPSRSHFSIDRIYIQKIVNFEIVQTSCISIRARDRKLFYTFAIKLGIYFIIGVSFVDKNTHRYWYLDEFYVQSPV